jgi:hypothetical protein
MQSAEQRPIGGVARSPAASRHLAVDASWFTGSMVHRFTGSKAWRATTQRASRCSRMRLRTYDDKRAVLELSGALELLVYFGPTGMHAVWMLGGRLLAWLDVASC